MQVCCGLDYLHFNRVVHGDLKPENLLLMVDGQLKIGDFGSSRWVLYMRYTCACIHIRDAGDGCTLKVAS